MIDLITTGKPVTGRALQARANDLDPRRRTDHTGPRLVSCRTQRPDTRPHPIDQKSFTNPLRKRGHPHRTREGPRAIRRRGRDRVHLFDRVRPAVSRGRDSGGGAGRLRGSDDRGRAGSRRPIESTKESCAPTSRACPVNRHKVGKGRRCYQHLRPQWSLTNRRVRGRSETLRNACIASHRFFVNRRCAE